jgi:hypothetical protein
MFKTLYLTIDHRWSWPHAAVLIVTMLICTQLFNVRSDALGHNNKVLDVRGWYTPEQAAKLLEALGPQGRQLYAWTQISLDLAFPIAYTSLFLLFIVRLFPAKNAGLLGIALAAGLADVLENISSVILALSYQGAPSWLAVPAAIFGAIKMLAFITSALLILYGGARGQFTRGV